MHFIIKFNRPALNVVCALVRIQTAHTNVSHHNPHRPHHYSLPNRVTTLPHLTTTIRHWQLPPTNWMTRCLTWLPPLPPNHHWQDHQLDASKRVHHHTSTCPTVTTITTVGFTMMTGSGARDASASWALVCFLFYFTVLKLRYVCGSGTTTTTAATNANTRMTIGGWRRGICVSSPLAGKFF